MFCSVYAKIQNIDLLGCFSFLGWWWCSISLTPTLPRRLRSKAFALGSAFGLAFAFAAVAFGFAGGLAFKTFSANLGCRGGEQKKLSGETIPCFPSIPKNIFLEVKFHQKAKVASSWLQYQPFGTRTQYVSPTRWLQLTLGDRHLGHPSGIAVVSLL